MHGKLWGTGHAHRQNADLCLECHFLQIEWTMNRTIYSILVKLCWLDVFIVHETLREGGDYWAEVRWSEEGWHKVCESAMEWGTVGLSEGGWDYVGDLSEWVRKRMTITYTVNKIMLLQISDKMLLQIYDLKLLQINYIYFITNFYI